MARRFRVTPIEVVGINTAVIAHGQGIAIPIDMASQIVARLKDSGEVARGRLGVNIQDLKGELAEYYGAKDSQGVQVSDLTPENAGMMVLKMV